MNLFITSTTNWSPSDAIKIKLNKSLICLCEEEDITNCSINLKIMDDMEMQKLNKDFRSINKPTNVLSFANEDISKEHTGNLGDIAINSDYVTRESNEQNKQYDDHMIHMLIHGVYHILGYDHEQNEEAYNMELKEVNLLKKLDLSLIHISEPTRR